MFYEHKGLVKLIQNDLILCPVSNISFVIDELFKLKEAYQPTIKVFAPLFEEEEEEEPITVEGLMEERYTAEGIDKLFQTAPNFIVNPDFWREDAPRNWLNLNGEELFRRYQKHAEFYCQSCKECGIEPTYAGFRLYLINLKNGIGEE